MITDLYKSRSYLGCLSASYIFICNNIFSIFKKTALWAALVSVVVATYCFVGANAVEIFSAGNNWAHTFYALVIMALAFVIYARAKASLVSILNAENVSKNFRKTLIVNGVAILVYLFVLIVTTLLLQRMSSSLFASKTSECALYAGLLLSSLLLISLAATPLLYSMTKYILETDAKINVVWKSYRDGLRHLGYVYCLCIILALLVVLSTIFLAIPAIVTVMASNVDSYGVSNGDLSGLPGIFPWLNGFAIFLLIFIMTYVFIFIDLALCYAYGHVEVDLQLKEKITTQRKE